MKDLISYFQFLKTRKYLLKGTSIVGTAVFCMIVTFFIGAWTHLDTKSSPVATAEWAPEALSLVDSIKHSGIQWNAAEADLLAAQRAQAEAITKVNRAEAAAKGADLTLCAKFQARYDRTTDKIVTDINCPLL